MCTNENEDPFTGTWSVPKQVQIPGDPWAIDPSIFALKRVYYFLYVGYVTPGVPSSGSAVYISPMSSITTLTVTPSQIAKPTELFSMFDANNVTIAAVNEGPHFWSHEN